MGLVGFLLHLARFARALRGDWHRLGKQTDSFYFVDNRITPHSYNHGHLCLRVHWFSLWTGLDDQVHA